jgi:integron integrase
MQTIDLQPFVTYMRERNVVDEQHAPFYVKWVRLFLTSELPPVATALKDRIQAFSDMLAGDANIKDWQLRQAVRAVELYAKVFLPSAEAPLAALATPPVEATVNLAETVYVEMRDLIRVRHYAYRTEQTYLDWVRRYMAYAIRQELDWQKSDTAKAFLSSLATQHNVAAPTQNQAFSALLFLLREVLKQPDPDLKSVRARQGTRLPVVLSRDEVQQVFKATPVEDRLLLQLAYGAGLRVSELIRLRVKDLDFDNHLVIVREGKGSKDRGTLLPRKLDDQLRAQIKVVKRVHEQDLAAGYGAVYLPFALDRKYPSAPKEFGWQYLFPADDLAVDPRGGMVRRHHISDQVPQRIMRDAVRKAGIDKPASIHCLRHSFATHMLLKGVNIREVQKYLGHVSVETTMIYTHVIRGMDSTAESPLDEL